MSRKLATTIKDSAVPGKYKRVLEAYAAFANNDGTNIYPAAKKLGAKAGCSPDTVYRNTPELIASTILVHPLTSETLACRVSSRRTVCSLPCRKQWLVRRCDLWGSSDVVSMHRFNIQWDVRTDEAHIGLGHMSRMLTPSGNGKSASVDKSTFASYRNDPSAS